MFSCEFCEVFKNTCFYGTPTVAASTHLSKLTPNSNVFLKFKTHQRALPWMSNGIMQMLECFFHIPLISEIFHRTLAWHWIYFPKIYLFQKIIRKGMGITKKLQIDFKIVKNCNSRQTA